MYIFSNLLFLDGADSKNNINFSVEESFQKIFALLGIPDFILGFYRGNPILPLSPNKHLLNVKSIMISKISTIFAIQLGSFW